MKKEKFKIQTKTTGYIEEKNIIHLIEEYLGREIIDLEYDITIYKTGEGHSFNGISFTILDDTNEKE